MSHKHLPAGTLDAYVDRLESTPVRELPSPSEMAVDLGISYRTLRRYFTETGHGCYNKWLKLRRLRRACELLRTTDLKLLAVAYELGFSTTWATCEMFRSELNTTPMRYRVIALMRADA